jgi:acyl transferase domain-containing protein/acyl carrier protein
MNQIRQLEAMSEADMEHEEARDFDVAVVGMAGRFPGADDLDRFWSNLREGVESITHFSVEELRAAGIPESELADPGYVRSIGRLRDVQTFDAGFFGYSPREAEMLEPGHRLFLECAWEALEDAGHVPGGAGGRVGVYAGAGSSGYTERHVMGNPELLASVGAFQAYLASGKDFLATRASYKLDLRGPSLNVQTACSTALVAVHLAVQSLLSGECELALAGGATVLVPQDTGYPYAPGSISSPDGHCRAFDAKSAGTLSGSGVGVVVLKRLADALRDGDPVRAVIRGSAVNNDGAAKVAYTAPGVEGQAAVIGEALSAADVDASTVTYVEAHGSGTDLGDTIEIAALTRAYRAHTPRTGYCAVGAVKTNVGHLDTAAGIAGFIKTVLALENAVIPPTVHFDTPNPAIAFDGSPFFVSHTAAPWKAEDGVPRRAGVSSFGIGGTNAHVILEEAPERAPSGPSRPWQLLTLSARTPAALDAAAERLAAHLQQHPELPLADVAFTLREGRKAFAHRRAVVIRQGEDAAAVVASPPPDRVVNGVVEGETRSVAFLFPGLGDHYPNMARGLYEAEPVFRAEVDRCAAILRPLLGRDVREVLFPGDAPSDEVAAGGFDLKRMLGRDAPVDPRAEPLNHTALAQPAVFVIDYALAKLWMSFGIVPAAVIGHSLGEYAAACIAGVLSLDDALALVADRARMIQELPAGAMLAVSLGPDALRPYLSASVAIAAENAPGLTVVAGPEDAVEAVRVKLEADGRVARRLATTHAFHSPMMAPAAGRLAQRVAQARLSPPSIPLVSNVTGTWISDAEAMDPGYWTRHLLGTVRFAEGVAELLKEPGRVLLEVGPGQTLSTFVRQRPADASPAAATVPSLRYAYDRRPDAQFLLEALGRLWTAGVTPDWKAFRAGERRRRVRLPTYPWERQRYWIEAPSASAAPAAAPRARRADPAEWTYVPAWTRTPAAPRSTAPRRVLVLSAGTFGEGVAAALGQAGHEVILARAGDHFASDGHLRTLRPLDRGDHRALVDSLAADDLRPDVVVDVRPADTTGKPALGSLLLLADALAGTGAAKLVVVTAAAQEVVGSEGVNPRMAALLGVCAVLPREYPSLACRAVDVLRPAAESLEAHALAARLAADVVGAREEAVTAYRGPHRWVRTFQRFPAPLAPALREGGAYLLVGDAAGRNARFAEVIAATPGVRIALVAPAADPRLVTRLEALGAAVRTIEADDADRRALADAVVEAAAWLGPVHGVIYSPNLGGAAGLALVSEAQPVEWAEQVAQVGERLDALDGAITYAASPSEDPPVLRDQGPAPAWVPDFRLVESSLAGVLGVVGRVRHAAANALTDAFVVRRRREGGGGGWTSVAWDRWMADGETDDGDGIREPEVAAALERVLALAGEPVVLVSTSELDDRVRAAAAPPAAPSAEGGARYARPLPDDDYAAPTNEVEQKLAEMWQELLGIERVGIHDNFFGLGGHSLLATQIVSRVRVLFRVDLRLAAIFEAPTVARLAELIEDAIIAELEALSDDEVAAMVAR